MNRIHRLPLAMALALGSSPAWALGLGQLEVKSSLYQPLEAELRVLSSVPGETDGLEVRLASPEAFERAGLDRPAMLAANLQFALGENDRGEPVIRISTPSRVNDPFLSFLLEVEWERGRLLREVTVLLDPPSTAPATRVAATPSPARAAPAEPSAAPQPEAPAPEPTPAAPAPARSEPVATPTPAPAQPAPSPAADLPEGEYGPVASGETLWSIAQRTRPDAGVSVNQMMAALLRLNPEAFIDQNINKLRRGAILRLPDRGQLAALSPAEANALVREQMDAWRSALPAQPQPAEPESRDSAGPAAPSRSDDSRLELVPPRGEREATDARSGVEAGAEGRELRAELARAREDISARDQEIGELRSRVDELERLQDDSERLIDLKDSELARLQQRLAQLEAEAAAADGTTAPAADLDEEGLGDAAEADADSEGPAAAEDEPAADASDATTASTDSQPPAPVEPPAPAETRPERQPPAQAAQPAEPRPPQPWYRNTMVMGIAGGALVLLGLLALLVSRRRSRAAEPSRPSRGYDSGSLAATIAATKDSAQQVAAGPDDREAELLDALSEQPEDLARHLELVRHYYEQNEVEAFEGAVEAMYAQVYDPDDMRWKQVVAMGREVLPDHPLFITADADADIGEPGRPGDEAGAAEDWQPETAEPEPDFTPEPEAAPAADAGTTQQISFEDLDRAAAGSREPDDFDDGATGRYEVPGFDLPEAVEPEPAAVPEPEPAPFAEARPEAEPAAHAIDEDASSTKLELARAYLDMGDVEGARGMLEEVLGEGNPGQRAEARRLLDEIR